MLLCPRFQSNVVTRMATLALVLENIETKPGSERRGEWEDE